MGKRATLESLPTEIRTEVLKSIPDLCSLSSLLHASPTYYQTYVSLQQEVLATVVSRQYFQGTAADVVAALFSGEFYYASDTRTKEEAIAFLDRYRHARGSISLNALLTPSVKSGKGLRMKDLHKIRECLEALVTDYIRDMEGAHISERIDRDGTGNLHVSSLQRMRIVRAICRIQVYTYVFYQPRAPEMGIPTAPTLAKYFQLEEAYGLFCATFPPWERNEMWAIHLWFEDRTERMLDTLVDPAIDTHSIAGDPHYEHYIFTRMRSCGPLFLGELLRENDCTKQYNILHDECSPFSTWTYTEPGLDDCLSLSHPSELLYPADELVELCRHDMGDQISVRHLQRPISGWEDFSYERQGNFIEMGMRIFGIRVV